MLHTYFSVLRSGSPDRVLKLKVDQYKDRTPCITVKTEVIQTQQVHVSSSYYGTKQLNYKDHYLTKYRIHSLQTFDFLTYVIRFKENLKKELSPVLNQKLIVCSVTKGISILYHFRLGLPRGLFLSGFSTKLLKEFLISPWVLRAPNTIS